MTCSSCDPTIVRSILVLMSVIALLIEQESYLERRKKKNLPFVLFLDVIVHFLHIFCRLESSS